jgi:acyl-CoA synthetase (NDP forming)
MIKEIKGLPILQGVRGEKSIAFETVKQVLLNLSQLSVEQPEIVEMDINPFMSFPESEKSKAVDARIRIAKL